MRKIILTVVVLIFALLGDLQPGVFAGESGSQPKALSSLAEFKRMLILEEGRIKPLDSYARNLLLQFSGRRTYARKPAVDWLARLLFAPGQTLKDKIFLINNPQIPMALGIEPEKRRRYSYEQLEGGQQKLTELASVAADIDEKQRNAIDQEIVRTYKNFRLYNELAGVFAFASPHPDFTIKNSAIRQRLELFQGQQTFSFADIVLKAEVLKDYAEVLQRKDPSRWSDEEREVKNLLSNLFQWSLMFQNLPLHIIPSATTKEIWYSPWDAIGAEFQDSHIRQEIQFLRDAMEAYWNGSQLEFDMAVRGLNHSIAERAYPDLQRALRVGPLELFYNYASPFLFAEIFYGLAFLFFLISLLNPGEMLHRAALILVWLGLVVHAGALLARVVIMARPPVTNLYETFIFVAFTSVVCGLIIERVNARWLGIMVASICGYVFLAIASKFAAEGDTLKMLVAVLNSNFWLSTHVVSITIGYAGACVAGVIGHVYIIQKLTRPADTKLLDSTYRNLLGALGFALTMTFLGTNLGGIWADQSWGRFWGWDPKENGALMIVLWTALIFHAKIARIIGPLGVAVGSALGIVVVMWAWFGVNLLSIGLHSYGFTSGVAYGLLIYFVCQILFLAVAVPVVKRRGDG